MSKTLDYNGDEGSTDQVQPGVPIPTTVGPKDYYDALNQYQNQGMTGAQAVLKAAQGGYSDVPASAQQYAQGVQNGTIQLPTSPTVTNDGSTTPDLATDPLGWITATLKAQGSTDSPQQWLQYYNQWGQTDPTYFQNRIQYAGNAQYPTGQPLPGDVASGQPGGQAATQAGPSTIDFGSILNSALGNGPLQSAAQQQPIIDPTQLTDALFGLINNAGNFNQNIVNSQSEAAAEQLNLFRQQQEQNDQAALAARGLVNSGPEITAENRLNQNVADQYSQAVQQIYGTESQNADQRMLQALGLASNLAGGNVNQALQQYAEQANTGLGLGNLENNYTLGLGNLALGNTQANNQYNLGIGQLGMENTSLQANQIQNLLQTLQALIGLQMAGANTSTQGYY